MSTENQGGRRPTEHQRASRPGPQSAGRRVSGAGGRVAGGGGKRPQKSRKDVILRRVYIGLTIVAAVIVAAFLFWHFFSAAPKLPTEELPPTVTTVVDAEGNLVEVEIPGLAKDRKEQVYTFLLVGQDTFGGGNTDTMMMASYDVPNQVLNVMSLPRDTYVRYGGNRVLLNSVFNRAGGRKDVDKGMKALKEEIGELTGVTPDYHVMVQWDAVGELVDAIDGVEFDVPRRMYYNDLSQDFKIDLQPGMQHLNGDQAMQLIRWRHNSDDSGHILNSGYATGDLGRIETQQGFMKAVIKKCLQPNVLLPNLGEYIKIFQENVITNLNASNMAYFAKSAVGKLEIDSVTFYTLPNRSAGDGAHLVPVGSEIVEVINQGFNPYQEEITLSQLDLVGGGTGPSSGTGPNEAPSSGGSQGGGDSQKPADTQETEKPDVTPGAVDNNVPAGPTTLIPTATPKPTAKPSERPDASPAPGESEAPEVSAVPGESQAPEMTQRPARPEPSPSLIPVPGVDEPSRFDPTEPVVRPTAAPQTTIAPQEPVPTAAPAPTAAPVPDVPAVPDDQPILPPGVEMQ